MRRVVVTGLGLIAPNGNDFETSWNKTLQGVSGVGRIQSFDSSRLDVHIAGEVTGLKNSEFFSPKELRVFSRFTQLAIMATHEALKSSHLEPENYLDPGIACFIGVGIGDVNTVEQAGVTLKEKGPKKISPFFIPSVICNMAAGNTAQFFKLRGPNICVSTACASGTHSIGEAWLHLKNGMSDVAVCGGTEAAVGEVGISGFSRMNALSRRNETPQTASRPFDRTRDGFVLSEGAGVLILEEYEHAKKRGAPIYAEMVGYGTSCDAYHMTSPSPGGEGASRCMNMALKSAGISRGSIGYINAHGSSTQYNDLFETEAIKKVFKEEAKKLLVSSTKGATGHCLGAAGGIEACFLAKTLKESLIPPTANLEEPGEGLDLNYVPGKALEKNVQYALSNSFGFGGTNASLVFKKWNA